MRLPIAVLLALALAPAAPVAGQEEEPVVIGTTTTLRSEILDEDRRLLITCRTATHVDTFRRVDG